MTNDQIKNIEDFLEGRMTPAAQESFERELETDRSLAAALDTYREVETYMLNGKKGAGEEEVKNTLAKLGAEFFSPASNAGRSTAPQPESPALPKRNLYGSTGLYRWLAAAVVLGIVLTGAWSLLKDTKGRYQAAAPSTPPIVAGSQKKAPGTATQSKGSQAPVKEQEKPEDVKAAQRRLFAAYFNADTVPAQKDPLLEDAFRQYESGHYRQASEAFDNAALDLSARGGEEGLPLSPFYASYYRAISLQALGKDAEAIRLLQHLSSNDPLLQAKAGWYLALSYIRTGRPQQALPLLTKLYENDAAGGYRQKAGRLRAELEK